MAERVDAARNRRAILAAAERLLTERGLDAVSMADVAAAAGVGKGTLFRRFGDRNGLLSALADQYRLDVVRLAGEVGAGDGSPVDKAVRLVVGMFDNTLRYRALIVAFDQAVPGSRYYCPSYRDAHTVLTELVAEHQGDRANAAFLAHTLLNGIKADFITYMLDQGGVTADGLRAQVAASVRTVLTGHPGLVSGYAG